MEIVQILIHVHFVFFLGESSTSRYSRNTDQRLHASFSSGEFGRLKPKDMSSPLVSDHNDSGRRVISPIRRRSDDDVSIAPCLIRWNICLLRFMITGCGVAYPQTLSGILDAFLPHELVGEERVKNPEESLRGRLVVARVYSRTKSCKNLVSFTRNLTKYRFKTSRLPTRDTLMRGLCSHHHPNPTPRTILQRNLAVKPAL